MKASSQKPIDLLSLARPLILQPLKLIIMYGTNNQKAATAAKIGAVINIIICAAMGNLIHTMPKKEATIKQK